MKVLVIGGGGREHTIVWKLAQSPRVTEIYCVPGNAGIGQLAQCREIPLDDLAAILAYAQEIAADFTIVGPEAPLAAGIVDIFEAAGLRIFGPQQNAAVIEGSKAFAKALMYKYSIPTAAYAVFNNEDEACAYIRREGAPIVVKADGLAAGKGVFVAMTEEEAFNAVHEIMSGGFGASGASVVVEEYLTGEEVSILAFTDGKTVLPLISAQDHKRIFDGDQGPNTGGMGAYAPAPVYTEDIAAFVEDKVLQSTVDGMAAEGRPYKGILYAGLMLTPKGVRVLEFNARFGDPETQAVLPLLKTDLLTVMEAVVDGSLDKIKLEWQEGAAVCVVMASGGYPGPYGTGKTISGLDLISEPAIVFHAGTAVRDEKIVTAGGRVLGVTATAPSIKEAIRTAYKAVDKIGFADAFYRHDIGHRAL